MLIAVSVGDNSVQVQTLEFMGLKIQPTLVDIHGNFGLGCNGKDQIFKKPVQEF